MAIPQVMPGAMYGRKLKVKPISTDVPAEGPRARYSLDGDEQLEARIADDQRRVAAAVRELIPDEQLLALALTGAYGRGEGGSVESDTRQGKCLAPGNGYDYLVMVRKLRAPARARLDRQLSGVAQRLGSSLGVPIRFRLLPWEHRRRGHSSLERAELRWGCRVIAGDQGVLERLPAIPMAAVAPGELTLRMLEVGAGLLMNQQQLLLSGPSAGRVAFSAGDSLDEKRRQGVVDRLALAILACGDALLGMNASYHPSFAVRLERLQQLRSTQPTAWVHWLGPGQDHFLELYRFAYAHRLRGDDSALGGASLADWQTRVRRSWLTTLQLFESERLGMVFRSWPEYCRAEIPKGLRTRVGALRRLLRLPGFGLAGLLAEPRRALRDPSERLIAVLPMLLNEVGQRPDPCVCTALGLPSDADWRQATTAFLRHWAALA